MHEIERVAFGGHGTEPYGFHIVVTPGDLDAVFSGGDFPEPKRSRGVDVCRGLTFEKLRATAKNDSFFGNILFGPRRLRKLFRVVVFEFELAGDVGDGNDPEFDIIDIRASHFDPFRHRSNQFAVRRRPLGGKDIPAGIEPPEFERSIPASWVRRWRWNLAPP